MPANRNALVRYKTIDQCLQNRRRRWTLDDLIEACSAALEEYEGMEQGVSRRTIQADIQMMRSEKLGYYAPIVVVEKKFYTYEDPDYSITHIPLSDQDLEMLGSAVEFMKQFKGFSHFRDLESMVQKFEAQLYSQRTHTQPVIDFEKNDNLKGLNFLEPIYQAIIAQQSLHITYQSFKARNADSFDFHAYLLKEFRNRWFVIGRRKQHASLHTLALDRMVALDAGRERYIPDPDFNPETYFRNNIGVTTQPNMAPEQVILFLAPTMAPYVLTKPLHHSQKLVEKTRHGTTISLEVQMNMELEKEILSFGNEIRVMAPIRLRRRIMQRMKEALEGYETDIEESNLVSTFRRLKHRGYASLNRVYTSGTMNLLLRFLETNLTPEEWLSESQGNLLVRFGQLKQLLLNNSLEQIIAKLEKPVQLASVKFLQFKPNLLLALQWSQALFFDDENPEPIPENGFESYLVFDDLYILPGLFQVFPGSHKQVLSAETIDVITANALPQVCDIAAGGILLMHPQLLRSFVPANFQRRIRLLRMVFVEE